MSNKKFSCNLFKERVLELMKAQNITIKQITKDREGEISFSWFTKLKQNKIKSPSADIVFMLANYFDVSTDYLLGISDIPTQETELKAVCEYTGLSQKAIDILSAKDHLYIKPTLSKVLESEEFWFVIYSFTNAIINKDFLNPNADYVIDSLQTKIKEDKIPEIYRKSLSLIGQKGLASIYKQEW